ncbi:uroporphyrinogen-III synthase [Bacillus tuaregi]|uniref:uroporphyrinogen-III synthase n=1 Tax=Bacillus tuaregi TaxID=1816695 RepID=UPI0008F8C2B3|nr:uroporphyrinogen-III synthase [Bacillus tuaregi]
MTASSPLKNKTVLVPRGKGQAKAFSDVVRKFGGTPIEIPLLAFRPTAFLEEHQDIMKKLHTYDWLILTSSVAVTAFLSHWPKGTTLPLKIAAIGEKTAQAIEAQGLKVDFIPAEYVAEAFVMEFCPLVKAGDRVLIPKGNLARDYISTELRHIGAIVDEIVIYETYFPEESKEKLARLLSENKLDIIPFTSPSTIDHFMQVVEENGLSDRIQRCVFACIGPVAHKKAESWGLTIHAVPSVYTVENLIKEVADYLLKVSSL